MNTLLRQFRDFFVSMQLTVGLLLLSLILVFVATLDQTNLGILGIQQKWFHSFIVLQDVNGIPVPVFPGGYLIGGFLLLNLLAAHVYRFKFTWHKSGIQLAHAGLILLLVGELLTGLLQKDSSMQIEEGRTARYSESFHEHELALIDHSAGADFDEVVSVPQDLLADKGIITHPKLPFTIRVKEFYPNSSARMGAQPAGAVTATAGLGTRVTLLPRPVTYKPNENNLPGAYIEISSASGPLGTWMVSPEIGMPQTFTHEGHTWELAMRLKRYYQPFAISLIKVSHDKYPGTEIPKNFSSRVRVKSDDGREDREVLIFMNNPLRFGGLTFYQYQMNAASRMTVFQVVRNPGWLLPYAACIMMGFGLCIQFGITLSGFISKRSTATAA